MLGLDREERAPQWDLSSLVDQLTPAAGTQRRPQRDAVDRPVPQTNPDVSVVVVHHETPRELAHCITSIADASRGLSVEVFVVDNASATFSPEVVTDRISGAAVVQNDANVGFAQAANSALRRATGRYLLLLNPDTVIAPDTLRLMIEYMDARPDVGCATARLVLPNGRLDLACRRSFPTPTRSFYRLTMLSRLFPTSKRLAQYNLTYFDEHREAEIDAPCGAFMMVRSEVREQVGLLDERYFMYGEDLDWAYRIKQAGWRIMYTPITAVTHIKGASSRQRRPAAIRAFYEAMRIFYRTYYEESHLKPVSWLTYAAISAREALELTSARISSWGTRG